MSTASFHYPSEQAYIQGLLDSPHTTQEQLDEWAARCNTYGSYLQRHGRTEDLAMHIKFRDEIDRIAWKIAASDCPCCTSPTENTESGASRVTDVTNVSEQSV